MSFNALKAVLNQEEIECLATDVKQKVNTYIATKNEAVINLEGEIQRIKADYEQRCYELDKKFIESASRLDSESTQNEKATAKCNQLENDLQELRTQHENTEKNLLECQKDNVSLKRFKDNWDDERLNLQHIVEKRDLEIARLNDEWKAISQKLSEAITAKNESQLKLDETMTSEVSSQYHVKRVEQEKDLLTQQNVNLTQELNKKTLELTLYRKEKDAELISLNNQLELSLSESKQLKETMETLKKNESLIQEKVQELQEKTTKTMEQYHSMESMLRSELQSQSRLAELYKSSAEDAECKSKELISAVEELQTLIKDSGDQNEALQQKLKESEAQTSEQYKEAERLKKELERANDLVLANKRKELSQEELAELCPTAAMTSKFIKSGMTLTQVYSLYVEQSDDLIVVKEENKRLNEAMDSILEELNAKAPLLKRQREDYERALVTINQLTSQTDEAAIEFQQIRQEADDAMRRSDHLQRENERFQKESADLSKQVRFLLKEIEELRGRQILMSPPKAGEKSLLVVNEDGSCNDVSSSSELISQTMVTFKDIAELQEQNQKLLKVIRNLTDDYEQLEKSGVDERTKSLQQELDWANEELQRLRDDRSRQSSMVEAIVRQRDMYRVLLAQNPEGGIPMSMLASPTILSQSFDSSADAKSPATPRNRLIPKPSPSAELSTAESYKNILEQVQADFTEYKKEVLENNKVMDKKVEEMREDLSQQKATCVKLDAQLELSKERYNLVQTSTSSAKKEADALRTRNNQLYSIIRQHEYSISNLNAELNSSQERNSKLQAQLETHKSELEISKRTEARLVAENTSLQREQRNQLVLLNNLQSMQQSMERQAFEVKSQLNTRIESQEREIKSLRQNSHKVSQSKQDEIQSIEKQLYVVQKQYDAEQLKSLKVSQELEATRHSIDSLEAEKKEAHAKLTTLEERLNRAAGGLIVTSSDVGSSDDKDTIKILQREVKEKSNEIINLQTRLEKAKRDADHFRQASEAAEESLQQTNETHKELMETLQSRLEETNKRASSFEQRVADLEEENTMLKCQHYKASGEVNKQTTELQKQLASVQDELEGAIRRRNEAVSNEQIAIEDLKQQVARAEEASDNYQREMILHSNAMQQLIQLKEQAKTYGSEIEKERTRARSLEESLKEKKETWDALEEKLTNESSQQKQRYVDIENQNKILHNQIQALSSRLVDLQSKVSSQSPKTPSSKYLSPRSTADSASAEEAGSGDSQSNEQLMDVIKYLRREKEISDTKSDLVQSEIVRTKQQLQQVEKQLSDVQESLQREQNKAQSLDAKLVKYESLEREVSILQATKNANDDLRSHRDKLEADLRLANERVAQMQTDLAPLQSKNRELSTQNVSLQAEKKLLKDEAERWKERVQQMTQSPRRQDPEEYRRLIKEKTDLATLVESMNKEKAELKSEGISLKGQVRTLDADLHAAKASITQLEGDVKAKEEEVKKAKSEVEEKLQTINRIRRVGRRFKLQYEELLAKQQKEEEEKKVEAPAENAPEQNSAKLEETLASLKQTEGNLMEERARLQALNQELARTQEENKLMKTQYDEATKKLELSGHSQSELQGENVALRQQSEEQTKSLTESKKQIAEMTEKEKKFSRLLTLAKGQIEKLRKDSQESIKERDRVQEQLKKLENERKSEIDVKIDLQNKIEDLQRQLLEGRAAVHPTSIQSSERKAANIRPISAQRVNQVTPMRVTRTARVMPEPQQESQEPERAASSSVSQAASSSTQASAAVSALSSVPNQTTAFVYPMSPARQQQHVVSSGTAVLTSSQSAQAQSQSDARVTSEPVASVEISDSDQAIVSSSDDQPVQEESSSSSHVTPSSNVIASSASVVESEASSSSARAASSSSVGAGMSSANNSRPFSGGQKRTHDESDDVSTLPTSCTAPGSNREAQVAVVPQPKRQRGSPDQSSESIILVTPSSGSQAESPQSLVGESVTTVRQPDQSQQTPPSGDPVEVDSNIQEVDIQEQSSEVDQEGDAISEEVSQSQQVYSDQSEAAMQQGVATSSVELGADDDVIVLSSDDSENDLEQDVGDDVMDDDVNNEESEEIAEDVDTVSAVASTTHPEVQSTQRPQINYPPNSFPFLVLPQEPSTRQRLPSRPAPLTPGIVPSSTDDGDGIVPCTPTLVTHRHDDSYQAISSPRVPPGGPVRFQFEDVTQTQTSLGAVPGGLGSVDNTLMDLAVAGDDGTRSVPSVPSSSSAFVTTNVDVGDVVRSSASTSRSAAVSSSIREEELEVETEELEQAIPSNTEVSSILTNSLRGRRRLRVKGAPRTNRGRGTNSPSTSNQP